jgi:hypothetical protein
MSRLDHDQLEFLHDCARFGPTDANSGMGHRLERLGIIEFRYEGASLQGRWRLTDKGREAIQQSRD